MDYQDLLDKMSPKKLLEELERYFPRDEWNEALDFIASVWDIGPYRID